MKKLFLIVLILALFSCEEDKIKPEKVFEIKGQQLTGICIDDQGALYVNFPRWREGVENSVVKITSKNKSVPFPDKEWNSWKLGDETGLYKFIAVQSVFSFEGKIYVLDTRNPLFNGVLDAPRVFVFDSEYGSLLEVYKLSESSYHKNSYINDLRINPDNNTMYFTDSGVGGLIALDLNNGDNIRILDSHKSTSSEVDYLTIDGKQWKNTVHSDGIAFNKNQNRLYYHSLTGYNLYSISTQSFYLEDDKFIEGEIRYEAKTPAPDGMIFDESGNLYMADLEHNSIVYISPEKEQFILYNGKEVSWADSFAIFNKELYYTNSKIHLAGSDVSKMNFTVYKIGI